MVVYSDTIDDASIRFTHLIHANFSFILEFSSMKYILLYFLFVENNLNIILKYII